MIDLSGFIGTERYHRFNLLSRDLVCTDGVIYLFNEGGCFWFGDIIASYQNKLRNNEVFQVWKLKKYDCLTNPKKTFWKVTCEDGNKNIIIIQDIEYSDFEEKTGLKEIELYLENGVIMLPSER